jgi:hypothetical protein
MRQKSFVPQAAKSVSQALMSDTSPGYREYNEAPSVTGIGTLELFFERRHGPPLFRDL